MCAQRLQISGSHSRAAAKHGHARVLHVPLLQLHPVNALAHRESGPRQLQYFSQKFPSLMHTHVAGLQPPGPQSHGVYWVHTWSSSSVIRRRITARRSLALGDPTLSLLPALPPIAPATAAAAPPLLVLGVAMVLRPRRLRLALALKVRAEQSVHLDARRSVDGAGYGARVAAVAVHDPPLRVVRLVNRSPARGGLRVRLSDRRGDHRVGVDAAGHGAFVEKVNFRLGRVRVAGRRALAAGDARGLPGVFVCLRGEFTRGDLRCAALAFSALAVAASPASRLILAASKRMGEAPVGASAEAFPRAEASMSQHRGPHGG